MNVNMSVVTDSPVHSSSSDDFIAFLDAKLDASSPEASPDKEAENQDKLESVSLLDELSVNMAKILEMVEVDRQENKTCFETLESVVDTLLKQNSGNEGNFNQNIEGPHSSGLYLVLDLDHTLLKSTHLAHLSSEESHLLNQTDSLGDVHIYLGDRPYALEMAKLVDPQAEYFNAKDISRDDGTQKHQKGLDVVLGQESAVVILDDTEHIKLSPMKTQYPDVDLLSKGNSVQSAFE
ncbi:unnamed protein product [Sphenostylis stenocarpa]|uniref:protein-serine/threonine phosphatase n=1 Tax=Sphenostylis stenocarpa TaxID=92480 RepID=A0AA86SH76_9FABA|nr:unnamed protein product [Sphenostylis stenocarpa]